MCVCDEQVHSWKDHMNLMLVLKWTHICIQRIAPHWKSVLYWVIIEELKVKHVLSCKCDSNCFCWIF